MFFIKNQHEKNINLYYKKKKYVLNTEDIYYFSEPKILSRRDLFFNKHFDFNQNFIFSQKKYVFNFKKKIITNIEIKENKVFSFFKSVKFNKVKIRKTYFSIVKTLACYRNFKKTEDKFNFFFFTKKFSFTSSNKKKNYYINNFFNKFFKVNKKKIFIFKKWWKKKKYRRKKRSFYIFKMFSVKNLEINKKVSNKNIKIKKSKRVKLIQNFKKINFINFNKKVFDFYKIRNKLKNPVSLIDKEFKTSCKENYVIRKKNYFVFNQIWTKSKEKNNFFFFIFNYFIFEIFYNAVFFRRMKRNKKHRRWQRFFIRETIFFIKNFIKTKSFNKFNCNLSTLDKKLFYITYESYFKNEFYKKIMVKSFSNAKSFVNKHNKKFKKYGCFTDFYFSKIDKINQKFFIKKYFKVKKFKRVKYKKVEFLEELRYTTRKRVRKEKKAKYWENYWSRHFRQFNESIYGEWSKDEDNRWPIIECFIEKRDKWIMQRDKKRPRKTLFEDYEMPHNPIFHENAIYNFSYEKEEVLKEHKVHFFKKSLKKINIKKYVVKKKRKPAKDITRRLMLLPSEFEYEMYKLHYTRTNENFVNFGFFNKKNKKRKLIL